MLHISAPVLVQWEVCLPVDKLINLPPGITFVLLAVRIKASRNEHTTRRQVDRCSSLLPRWAPHNDRKTSSEDDRAGNSLPLEAGDEMIDHTIDAKRQPEGGTDSDWALESSVDSIEPLKVSSIPH